jgi:hypothetical protein
MRATIVGVLVVLSLAGCNESEKQAAQLTDQQLAQLVLQQSDVGRGYQEFANGRTGRLELHPALEGQRRRFGRQDGWTVRYRPVRRGSHGPLTVVSTVDVFSADSGAKDFFDAAGERDLQTGVRAVPTERLGDESRGLVSAQSAPGSFRYVLLSWRKGRIVSTVAVTGLVPQPTLSAVTALGRRQERRIEAAL